MGPQGPPSGSGFITEKGWEKKSLVIRSSEKWKVEDSLLSPPGVPRAKEKIRQIGKIRCSQVYTIIFYLFFFCITRTPEEPFHRRTQHTRTAGTEPTYLARIFYILPSHGLVQQLLEYFLLILADDAAAERRGAGASSSFSFSFDEARKYA